MLPEKGLSVGVLKQARTRRRGLGLWPVVVPRFVRAQTVPAPVILEKAVEMSYCSAKALLAMKKKAIF